MEVEAAHGVVVADFGDGAADGDEFLGLAGKRGVARGEAGFAETDDESIAGFEIEGAGEFAVDRPSAFFEGGRVGVSGGEFPKIRSDAEEVDLAGRAAGWGIDLAAELEDGSGAGEIVGEAGAEEIFATGEDEGGAAGALFGDLAERGFHRISREQRT